MPEYWAVRSGCNPLRDDIASDASRNRGLPATSLFTKECKRLLQGCCFSQLSSILPLQKSMKKVRHSMPVRLKVIAVMRQIAVEQKITLPVLDDELPLHETGFDSLGFAILVARLEDDLGIDPFTMSDDATFPLTVGDFIRAYENVPA
jgi:acyl carrier protein